MGNILVIADSITSNGRKSDDYGKPEQSFGKIAEIASILSNKDLSIQDCINVMISLKLVRESVNHKEDNLVDAVGYLRILNDYKESIKL